MARVPVVSPDKAPPKVKNFYNIAEKSMGKVINIFQFMGNSPAVLEGYFGLAEAANHTSFSPELREKIALVVGQTNNCNYCVSAHSQLGKNVGIPDNELLSARKGESPDPKTSAILAFTKKVVEQRGNIKDDDVNKLKKAGLADAEVVELVLVIIVNMFTNYFNLIVDTPVDFPAVPKLT